MRVSDFKRGDVVEMSPEGRRTWGRGKWVTGVVVGFTRDREGIRVLRDGHKHAESFHPMFWRKATPTVQ